MLTPTLKDASTVSRKQNSNSATPTPKTVSSVRSGLRNRFSQRRRMRSSPLVLHVHVLGQHAFVQVQLPACHVRDPGVVRDDDDRLAEIAIQRHQQRHDFLRRMGVQVAGRFVGQQQVGIGGQCPGDRHTLLLAAGEFVGPVVHAVRQADDLETP